MKLSQLAFQPYAGIGSRETPPKICKLMEKIAIYLWNRHKMILRSGGADGADQAFQKGIDQHHATNGKRKEIFIPWEGFSNLYSSQSSEIICIKDSKIIQKSEQIAAKFHPNWNNLKQGARRLMARNTFQVLGADLNTFSKFVICWTKDGKDTRGTGQALRISLAYGVPIENLYNQKTFDKWSNWLNMKHEFLG